MRRLIDHRFDDSGFDEAVRGLLRNSPWWMTSLVIHAVALLLLWSLPYEIERKPTPVGLRSDPEEKMEEPQEEELEDPIPEIPDEVIVEEPPVVEETTETVVSDDTQDDFSEDTGDVDSPFTGPGEISSIGLGPGAGRRKRRARRGRNLNAVGSEGTQDVVDLGLQWLAEHQDVNGEGKWDCDDFMKHDPPDDRCDGSGGQLYDVGVTGLSLLAFLGAGFTDRGSERENRFARNVRMGLRYLMAVQSENGVFGTRATENFMYNQSIAALAMCEAYWMTRNPRYKKPAQDALNFLSMARNPYLAWRYEPRGGDNDTSITGWCVMALKSGKFAGLEADPDAFEGARLWIEKMTDPNFGQCGYNFPGGAPARPEGKQDRFPAERSQSMTAVGILTRIFLGEDPARSAMIKQGAKLCLEVPPRWDEEDGSIDMYYWYYGTLALFQVGGASWRKWNDAMKRAIVDSQHPKGSGRRTGSWDPIGAWGDDGGRVYSTALMVLCLEVYYRYDRVFMPR